MFEYASGVSRVCVGVVGGGYTSAIAFTAIEAPTANTVYKYWFYSGD